MRAIYSAYIKKRQMDNSATRKTDEKFVQKFVPVRILIVAFLPNSRLNNHGLLLIVEARNSMWQMIYSRLIR